MIAPSPKIKKAALVIGKTLAFRCAAVEDASFILSLRTNVEKSRYLSPVSSRLSDQQTWLERYTHSEDQSYFIIEYCYEPIGTVRLYDAQNDSFCWGSWILQNGLPRHVAIESALMVYAYAVDHLGFSAAHFDVRKGNQRVWQFHERFGAVRTGETELDYLYRLDLSAIHAARVRYEKYLHNGVQVTFDHEKLI